MSAFWQKFFIELLKGIGMCLLGAAVMVPICFLANWYYNGKKELRALEAEEAEEAERKAAEESNDNEAS